MILSPPRAVHRDFPLTRRDLFASLPLFALAACARRRGHGELRVGSSATGVPFSFVDPWSNELTGFMIDVVRQVSTAAQLPLALSVVPFSASLEI